MRRSQLETSEAQSVLRQDLQELAPWAERMSHLYPSLGARYDRFPGALIVGSSRPTRRSTSCVIIA